MKDIFRRILYLFVICIFTGVIAIFFCSGTETFAKGKLTAPKFSLKTVNKGTGVKLTIEKTNEALGYFIYISNTVNSYSQYMYNGGKYDRFVKYIDKDGTKQRSFTIKGLPKGKYTFKVVAYDKDDNEKTSKSHTISIKAYKQTKSVKEKKYDFSKAKAGDIIKFGSYEQDDNMTNGKEPIEWIVLERNKDQMFVVSRYALDSLPYHFEYKYKEWSECSIRTWLNEVFYNTAFTKNEKNMINTTTLINRKTEEPDYFSEKDSEDKVFLLAEKDLLNTSFGFSDVETDYDLKRCCSATEFAVKAQGAFESATCLTSDKKKATWWWLRTSGLSSYYGGLITRMGSVNTRGAVVNDTDGGAIRPAMYIKIK